ncbi:MAG: hypothetical protein J0L87_01440 [Bacteroidetes bacterium]|nr:hypothetical protein [Bacteroidota bacterium]
MKTKINLIFVFVILACSVYGQSVKKEFYDIQKTKIMAEYQVNAAGEKNGWFKGYDQKGVVVYEYNYKSNQFHGLNKEYTTVYGKREVMKSETFKDGVLEGPASYYGENGLVLKQGNYKAGNKDGKWLMIDPYSNYNIKNKDDLKGCEFVKSEVVYSNGSPVMDGKVTVTYYPSGKVRSEQEYSQGKKIGTHNWYFPNGKLEAEYKYNGTTEKYLTSKTYYTNGQLWEFYDWTSGKEVLMDYNEDGSPGTFSKRNMAAQKETNATAKADSAFSAGNYELGISICNEAGIKLEHLNKILSLEKSFYAGKVNDVKYQVEKIDNVEGRFYSSPLQQKHAKIITDKLIAEAKKLSVLDEEIKNKWKAYTDAFTVPINNGSALDYPKGEFLYKKSRVIVDELYAPYSNATTPNDKQKAGELLIPALDKMIKLASSDKCKDLNKQLKKVEDKSQIKTLLGL